MKLKTLSYQIIVAYSILFTVNIPNVSAQNNFRSVEELTTDTSGWPYFNDLLKLAKNKVEILPANPTKAKEALYQIQVTTHSTMGAVTYFTGGILIDNGWIRILGSGSDKLNRSLPEWNKGKTFSKSGEKPGFLLVADDVIGGFFAINSGALGNDTGNIYYLSPDALQWEPLGFGYTDFLNFCLSGDLNKFYDGLRWDNWIDDVKTASGTTGFHILPPLWTKEGKDINKDSRKLVPIKELYELTIDMIDKLTKK